MTRFALRRCASRVLSSRPSTLVSASRTYSSISASPFRTSRQIPSFQSQRRWASTEGEQAAVSTEQPPRAAEPANATEATEEALPAAETNERLTSETRAASSDDAPAAAETANATEATEEALPAAETNETLSAKPSANAASSGVSGVGVDGLFERKKTLYIGNLFFDVTEADLVKEFARFGPVAKCKVVRDARGLSKGFAYVDFSTQEAADAALENLNMQLFEGRRITVQYAARPTNGADTESRNRVNVAKNPPSRTLFIGNMSFEMTDRDLSNLFRGIKNVIDVRVAIDRRTGQPRGFAHADFIDVKSAMDAMKALAGKEIYGRRLRVDYSYSSASRAPRNEPEESGPAPESAPQ
ncbi:hypothetical protein PV08_00675 [Exophiala spinifera]|uniref:RRM domain-containing protein n=1 Tax=Exophiala spinifera TaxID=91928 RepID=A0A0D2BNJ4_9EURO|nr:uncharacterized protein PV08_00675 [Exophiala spinifera]KIW20100.1 hypothetical protein PV08_00675 [Exophiala spinifera]